jgi:hypothetical protein
MDSTVRWKGQAGSVRAACKCSACQSDFAIARHKRDVVTGPDERSAVVEGEQKVPVPMRAAPGPG